MTAAAKIRVAVADDQALVRSGFTVLLRSADDIEVVGEAANGREAVDLVAVERPDVVLMDIRMPEMDGLEATRRIIAAPTADTRVLILTTFDLDEYVFERAARGRERLPAQGHPARRPPRRGARRRRGRSAARAARSRAG